MKVRDFNGMRKIRSLLWEWIQYHEGKGVMPDRLVRRGEDGVGIHYMTIFDPRRFRVGKSK